MFDHAWKLMPKKVREGVTSYVDAVRIFAQIRDPKVLRSLAPSGVRGLLLKRGKQGVPARMTASHDAYFDWTYPSDQPEMADLYARAKRGQWDGARDLDWATDVDLENWERPILPPEFADFRYGETLGIKLSRADQGRLTNDLAAWSLSQFLHGEQGALLAAAQVTEAVQFFDGKLYGATQVVDEARHVEVFSRYLDTKLGKLYHVNDNLFVIIDALMADSRWDMKFIGMQIMIEGLALGAFATMHQLTSEPLLKSLLRGVIQDEARHVHYGVVALREHLNNEVSDRERREREDWAFEIAMLMRDRFMAREVYDEWFAGSVSWDDWKLFVGRSPGMEAFRHNMFSRMVPNLREIGLMSPRIQPHYEAAGLMRYFGGRAADAITAEDILGAPSASLTVSAA